MRALLKNPDGELLVAQAPNPTSKRGQVLIKVEAASFSRADWGGRHPLHRAPSGATATRNAVIPGSDVAGTIVQAPPGCALKVGDRACAVAAGLKGGAAEYAVADAAWCTAIPDGMSAVQAAALPSSATTALAALDKAGVVTGRRVLVCGASGGVGQYATLLFAQAEARVTAACGPAGLQTAKTLGAEQAFDYTDGLIPAGDEPYDTIVAINGKYAARDYLNVLRPGGSLVVVGTDALSASLLRVPAAGRRLRVALFFSCIKKDGLRRAAELVAGADAKPAIEELDGLDDALDRLATVADRHPREKLVVRI